MPFFVALKKQASLTCSGFVLLPAESPSTSGLVLKSLNITSRGRGFSERDLSLHNALLYKIWSIFDIINQLF